MVEITLNYWAVLTAAAVYMAVGALWYGPLFGKTWMHLMGMKKESVKRMKLTQSQSIGLGFVTALVMAYVFGYFVMSAGAMGVLGAWKITFCIWLGFFATASAGSFIWEGKPFKLFVLKALEQLIALFLMALVLVMW